MKSKLCFIAVAVISFVLAAGCKKSDSEGTAVIEVRLTDAPADYEEVLVDNQDVQVESPEGWKSLDVNKGVYNLLDFRNGLDTLLGTAEIQAGHVSQVRLVLGENNKVRTTDGLFDLQTPSAQQSGLKLNIDADLTAGIVYRLWIDFDAARSVVDKGNGGFSLKPVIRAYSEAQGGAIAGIVSPAESLPVITAISNGDTLSTLAAEDGNFILRAVPAGTWSVEFRPVSPYIADTLNGVEVQSGMVTELDTVVLN